MHVAYITEGSDLPGRFRAMWERLNAHHGRVSPDFAHLYAGRDFSWRLDKWRRLGAGGIWNCLALADGVEAGFCVCTLDGAGGGEVATLYVEQAFRRRGIGAELVRLGLAWLAAHGAENVALEVVGGNDGAVAFYRSQGFRVRKMRLELRENK